MKQRITMDTKNKISADLQDEMMELISNFLFKNPFLKPKEAFAMTMCAIDCSLVNYFLALESCLAVGDEGFYDFMDAELSYLSEQIKKNVRTVKEKKNENANSTTDVSDIN